MIPQAPDDSIVFEKLFNPSSIAVFGSVKKNKIAHQVLQQLEAGRFAGTLHSINPKAEEPEGLARITVYSDVESVDAEIDLAVIAAPARFCGELLEKCGRKGIRIAVILTSGFSEIGNVEGEKELQAVARTNRIRVIGPNCAGIMCTDNKVFASIEERALPGRAAFITQSGAVGGAVLAMALERQIGFSHFVSFGNRCDISEIDFLDIFLDDDEVDILGMYLESVKNGRQFLQKAAEFVAKKPLLVIKSGRSETGMRATSSHTGSLAGSDRVFDALCRQTGILRVEGIEEFLDLCAGFSSFPPVTGRRLLVVTNSGGPAILTVDKAEALKMQTPKPSAHAQSDLAAKLPANSSILNPIDMTVEAAAEHYRQSISLLLEDEYDSAIAINVATPFMDSAGLARGIIRGAESLTFKKPVLPVFMAGRVVKKAVKEFTDRKIPCFPTGERAVTAVEAMARYYGMYRSIHAGEKQFVQNRKFGKKSAFPQSFLEPDQVAFLEKKGFPFPGHFFAGSIDEIIRKGRFLHFPAVMKVVSPSIVHKSDVGGVLLNLQDVEALKRGFTHMQHQFVDSDFKGVMVYEQVQSGLEIIVGVTQDADFGPIVLAGAGGIFSELIDDTTLRGAPFDQKEAHNMLDELKISAVLEGYRGTKFRDREGLENLLVNLSKTAIEYPQIREVDLNPVFIQENNVIIGDVRIILDR